MIISEFSKPYAKLCAGFGQAADEGQMLLYFDFLKNYPLQEIEKAVNRIISKNIFFPKIAEIIDILNPPDVGKSWEKVLSVASGGCRSWNRLSDIEIATVSAIGGIGLIQNSTEEGLPYLCRDFKNTFPAMVKRGVQYNSDDERLKDLNMVPETYLFLKKTKDKKEIAEGEKEIPEALKQMLGKIGQKI